MTAIPPLVTALIAVLEQTTRVAVRALLDQVPSAEAPEWRRIMVELILVRHAKSDWGDPALSDHDRPLNARGRADAPSMATRTADAGLNPQRILSSTARRARATAAEFGGALGVKLELVSELYAAPAAKLRRIAVNSGVDVVMIVAHNPGLSELAYELSGGEITHLPTCAVARFGWADPVWESAAGRGADSWSLETPR